MVGTPPASTVGLDGIQAVSTGMQGPGTGAPNAAARAAITAGFIGLLHIPKGGTFSIGIVSLMTPTGILEAMTLDFGRNTRLEGAIPKVHVHIPPVTALNVIIQLKLKSYARHYTA
jgi:hypothetical protein